MASWETLKIEDTMNLEFEKNGFHPIIDYLRSLNGMQEEDNVLIDYFGAETMFIQKKL